MTKKIIIIGIGGYATEHLRSIGILEQEGQLALVGAVVWREQRHLEMRHKLEQRGVEIFDSFDAMITAKPEADIISIPPGIMWHAPMIIASLRAGYHVICEKPLTGTVAEAEQICQAVEQTNRICAIGYQDMYSSSIAELKRLTLAGEFGSLLKARTLVKWPRARSYYRRNEWAGKLSYNGAIIYDSIAQNACAHFLQSMLFIAGDTAHSSAEIARAYGENYRAKEIESADTQYIRVMTKNGIRIVFIGTHCVMEQYGPVVEYFYEAARIVWQMSGKAAIYDLGGELIRTFENAEPDFKTNVFRDTLESITQQRQPRCTPANARQHTCVIENAFLSSGGVHEIPQEYKETQYLSKSFYRQIALTEPDPNIVIKDIDAACAQALESGMSFAELGLPWAHKGKEMVL